MQKKVTIIIVGGSGSGKSTLESNLVKMAPEQFHKVLSVTTRAMRDGEAEGVTYNYVTKEEFKQIPMVESVEFGGNFYGIPEREFQTDKDTICVVEPHGAQQIIEYIDNPYLLIYMGPPNAEMMRLRGDSEEMIQKRLEADDIEQRFNESGLKADKVIKRLTPKIHLDVYEYIQIFKKSLKN